VGTEKKLEYLSICHDECYLKGVIQETLDDPRIGECTVMNSEEGKYPKCLFYFYFFHPYQMLGRDEKDNLSIRIYLCMIGSSNIRCLEMKSVFSFL
jgi:hypothetical protein